MTADFAAGFLEDTGLPEFDIDGVGGRAWDVWDK